MNENEVINLCSDDEGNNTIENASIDNDIIEIQYSKRKRVSNEEVHKEDVISQIEASECIVCFETYSTQGKTRAVTLYCGHLLCLDCATQLTEKKTTGARKYAKTHSEIPCPICKVVSSTKSTLKAPFITLYPPKHFSATDQSEIKELRKQNDRLCEQVSELKQELAKCYLKSSKDIDFEPEMSARALGFAPGMLVASYGAGTFRHGLMKISLSDSKKDFYSFHSNVIRDLKISPYNPHLVLTASIDKSIKLCDILKGVTIVAYKVPEAIWSCEFHSQDFSIFYAGAASFKVYEFNTSVCTKRHIKEIDIQFIGFGPKGIHSLVHNLQIGLIGGASRGLFIVKDDQIIFGNAQESRSCTSMRYCCGYIVSIWRLKGLTPSGSYLREIDLHVFRDSAIQKIAVFSDHCDQVSISRCAVNIYNGVLNIAVLDEGRGIVEFFKSAETDSGIQLVKCKSTLALENAKNQKVFDLAWEDDSMAVIMDDKIKFWKRQIQ